MRRDDLANELVSRQIEDGYVFPAYEGYCFSSVPGAVYDVLGAEVGPTLPNDAFDADAVDEGGRIERVVVVLVDGFGYEQWRRLVGGDDASTGFLSTVEGVGTVTPLTSLFPSETAAAIPAYHGASYPHEHGVYGWYQRVPELEDVVLSLPFTTVDGRPLTEISAEFGRDDLYLVADHYDRTETESGVDTRLVVPEKIAEGNARAVGYGDLKEFATELGETIAGGGRRSVTFAYLPHVDAESHEVGTRADGYRDALAAVDDAVSHGLFAVSDDVAERTLLVVTADHGHVDTDPATNVDLREPRFAPLWGLFERRSDGTAVPPSGSPRQLHLHLRDEPGVEDAARRLVERELDALVLSKGEAIGRELWGPGEYSETFRERCGDLLVVPESKGVWYESAELGLVGMHGGLTREEMLVPFATARLGDLR